MAELPGYFEDIRKKAERSGVRPYSVPSAGDAGAATPSSAPAAPVASASAPTATPGGGSGFVNFGSYFGANAPAIQAQAQKAVEQAKGTQPRKENIGVTAQVLPATARGGITPNIAVQNAPRSSGSYESQIADVSRQFEGLNQAAKTGTMGAGASAFDQMLGGGVTQRAAQAEQQRLGTLRTALEGEKAIADREAEARQQEAKEQAARDAISRWEHQWYMEEQRRLEIEWRTNELAKKAHHQSYPGENWDDLPETVKERYRQYIRDTTTFVTPSE